MKIEKSIRFMVSTMNVTRSMVMKMFGNTLLMSSFTFPLLHWLNHSSSACMVVCPLLLKILIKSVLLIVSKNFLTKVLCVIFYGLILMTKELVGVFLLEVLVGHGVMISQKNSFTKINWNLLQELTSLLWMVINMFTIKNVLQSSLLLIIVIDVVIKLLLWKSTTALSLITCNLSLLPELMSLMLLVECLITSFERGGSLINK